jgi:L-fuconolactonase
MVDTHVHLWDPNRFRYPWLEDRPALNRPFLLSDYDRACGSLPITRMVFMQCEAVPSQGLDEARWVLELAQEEPRLQGIIAWAPLEQGEASRPWLDELGRNPLVKGVRRLIQGESDPEFCLQPDFVQGVRMLADYGMSFDLCIAHTQLAQTLRMVAQCPEVSFILDHLGKPDIKGQVWEPWATEMKALSEYPNVVCKISGMITEADHEKWTPEDLKPYVDHVIGCFGFDRVLYGGDWPVVTLAGEYQEWVAALEWSLADYSADERKKLFHDNAVRVYRIG